MIKQTNQIVLLLLFVSFYSTITAQTITAKRFLDNTIKNYTCDGVDDHIQINEALEFVKDKGGIVNLSANTFYIDSSIYIAGNKTTLQGAGMNETTIKLIDNAGWCYFYPDGLGGWLYHETKPLILNKPEAVQNLALKDFKIDGNKYNQFLYNPLSGDTIRDTPNSAVFDGQGHYVAVDLRKKAGSVESVSDIIFSRIFIYENSDDGLVVNNGTNIIVEYCKGVRSGHSNVYFHNPINLTVNNCDFMVTSNSGIRWYDGNHIVIENNHIYGEPEKTGNSNFCIQMTSGQYSTVTNDLIIRNNRLEFTAGAGIALDAKESITARDAIIKNNVILQCGNSGTTENMREAGGINIKNFTNTIIENNTIVNCIGGGIRLGGNVGFNTEWSYETGLTAVIKNNIITNTVEGGNSTASGYGIDIASGNSAICTFNNVWGNKEGDYFGCSPDLGSISVDPKFRSIVLGSTFFTANDTSADLHLQSKDGRWNSLLATWETDTISSICINGGDPNAEYSNEPENNGDRLNLGAYGNSEFASKGENAPPVANAGPDQYVRDDNNDGIVFITLDGRQSTDNDTIISYSWVRNTAEISDTVLKDVAFVLGAVEVTLTVVDRDGITSSDKTIIKVLPTGQNKLPVANAGEDIKVTDIDNTGSETVFLSAENSYDVDAIITEYEWFENGVSISTELNTAIDFSTGTHNVILKVTDNEGGTDSDTIVVKVNQKGNYALEFGNDFNDEVVQINNLPFYSTYTFEMWVNKKSTEDDACIIWLGGDGRRIMVLSATYPSWDETYANTANSKISLNTWHHLAYVIENDSLKALYVDGNSTVINNPNHLQKPTNFAIGSYYGTTDAVSSNFVGLIDEIRYWSTARTQNQINSNKDKELVGDEAGLIAYWSFNDGSGTRLTDLAGTADGTLLNMEEIDWVSDTPFGSTVNIEDHQKRSLPNSLSVYPNPANSTINISADYLLKSITICDITGKKVFEENNINRKATKFDIRFLENGIYFVKTNSATSKFIKLSGY